MPPSKRLAMRLRKIREERGITQEALARRARISRVYLAQLERRRQDPSLSVVVRLAKALKVKVGDLVD
jgi:transcriptional regulator with XRE-family HTH domain